MPAKGTSKFGADVVVGTPEYWRLYYAENKSRHKEAQARYRLRQRQAYLAKQLSEEEHIPIEQALEEITAETGEALKLVRDKLTREGRITQRSNTAAIREDEPIISKDENEIAMIQAYASQHSVSFADAERITDEFQPHEWEEEFAKCQKVVNE